MDLHEIAKIFGKANSALIFCHSRPDGDTLGCAMAIKLFMEKQGKTADIVCDSPIPQKFWFIETAKEIKTVERITSEYDVHLAVDCSTERMLGDNYGLFCRTDKTINIDHHISNTKYAEYNYVQDRGACCEIVYELLKELNATFDKDVATSLMLGLSTDTGHFMHSNVSSDTLRIASELVASGADIHDIGYRMFKSQTKSRALLQAKIMSEMKFFSDDKIAMITVMQSDLEKFGATTDLTEGFIDYPLSISGVEVAVSVLESKENCFKISLRSKGKVNVNEIASAFGGGGHVLASGCMICGFYEDVKDKIIRAINISLE